MRKPFRLGHRLSNGRGRSLLNHRTDRFKSALEQRLFDFGREFRFVFAIALHYRLDNGFTAKNSSRFSKRNNRAAQGWFGRFQFQRNLARSAGQTWGYFHRTLRSSCCKSHASQLRPTCGCGAPKTRERNSATTDLKRNHPTDHANTGHGQNEREQLSSFEFTRNFANAGGSKRRGRCRFGFSNSRRFSDRRGWFGLSRLGLRDWRGLFATFS